MIESLQLIQREIELVIDQMSRNDPSREHLIIANKECDELINHFINDGK